MQHGVAIFSFHHWNFPKPSGDHLTPGMSMASMHPAGDLYNHRPSNLQMLYATMDVATSGKGNTNNQIAHQIGRAIGPALAVTNITTTNTSLETEPKLYLTSDPLYHPYNISFHPNNPNHHLHEYNIITIANATKPLPSTQNLASSEDCITTLTANSDTFLQDFERRKLNRSNNTRANPPIPGKAIMKWGPSTELCGRDFWYYVIT